MITISPQPQVRGLASSFLTNQAKFGRFVALACCLGLFGTAPVSQALTFNFIPAVGMDAGAIAGFTAAGARWSSIFTDPVTVNINIGYSSLGAGILASTGSAVTTYSYGATKAALIADATPGLGTDATAVANLPGGSFVPVASELHV